MTYGAVNTVPTCLQMMRHNSSSSSNSATMSKTMRKIHSFVPESVRESAGCRGLIAYSAVGPCRCGRGGDGAMELRWLRC